VIEMCRRKTLAVAVIGAALGVWVTSSALAGLRSFRTEVTLNFAGISTGVFTEGQVISPKSACEAGRKVLIIAITPSGNRVVDTDRTSDNGFYGGGGRAPGAGRPIGVKVKAPRAVIGKRGRRSVCRGDAFAVRIPPG
jgi:hypothetical protein